MTKQKAEDINRKILAVEELSQDLWRIEMEYWNPKGTASTFYAFPDLYTLSIQVVF